MKLSMKSKKIIILISSIQVLGIKQPYVQNCMENCLKILLDMQLNTDIISCVLLLHMIKNTSHEDEEISIGDSPIHKTQQQKH